MRIAVLKIFSVILLGVISFNGYSQLAGCNAAQNACSNPSLGLTSGGGSGLPGGLNVSNPGTNPQTGNGANPGSPIRNTGCLLSNAPGPNWMILTVSSTGMLGFSFGASGSPNPQTGLYDWAMWRYDANTCTKIFNNTLAPVACNWNGSGQGGTGMGAPTPSAISASGIPLPAGNPVNFQPSIPVTVGDQFIILLSNWSGVTTNVSIMSNGSAGLSCSPLALPSVIRCPSQQAVISGTWAANVTSTSYTITSALPLSAGSFTVQNNPTFIVAPAATQVYTVFAAGNNSLNAVVTTSNTFTVTISPTTTMNLVSPNPNNVCYGTPATIQAELGGTNYTLTGPPTTPTIVASTPIVSTPTLSSGGVYTISTTLFSGCTATVSSVVNVSPNHTIAVNAPLNVCLYGTANLTANLPTATSYFWQGPNSYTSNLQNPPIPNIQLTAGGIYTVMANINFNGITCARTATTKITVVQTSPVAISVSPSQTLCQGSNLYLSSSITGTAGFIWSGPSNFNASAQTATVSSLMPNNAGFYKITAIFSNGIISCPVKDSVRIIIRATAIPTLTFPGTICQNGNAVLTASAAASANYYAWSGPNSFSSPAMSPTIANIQPQSSGTYYVKAFFVEGAVTCSTQASGVINVVPVNTVSVIPPQPVCLPNNVNLHSSAIGALSYTWTGPNNYVEHQANPILFHPNLNAAGIYTVTVAFGGGALVCYNTNTVEVFINPTLSFDLSAKNLNTQSVIQDGGYVCYDTPIQFNGPAGATSYIWSTPSGVTGSLQNLNIPLAQPSDEGIYTLTVSLGQCITTRSMFVSVKGRITQTYAQHDVTVCRGDTVTLKEWVEGGTDNPGYTWNPPLYLESPNIPVQHTKPLLGTTIYSVKMWDNLCPAFSITHSFKVTVLENPKQQLHLESTRGCQPVCQFYDSKIEQNNTIITYDFLGSDGSSRRMQDDKFSYCLADAAAYTLRIKTTKLYEAHSMICSDSSEYASQIVVDPKPGSDITWIPERPTVSDNNVTFLASSKSGGVTKHDWLFSGTFNDTINTASPQRVFDYSGKYPVVLTATNEFGCTDTTVKFIEIKDDFNVFIPNSFTPNGDNLNDVFQMKGEGIKQTAFSMEIFDRWGNMVFFTKDPAKGWDGTIKGSQEAGEGIYVYKIKLSGANGEGRKEYLGQLTLLR